MLVFTNRIVDAQATTEAAFTRRFTPASDRLALADATHDGNGWTLSQIVPQADDNTALHRLVPLFQGARPLLVYLHGNNNTPKACFDRCARLESLYDVEVIGFSWASEGFLADGSDMPGLANAPAEVGDEDTMSTVRAANRTENGIQRRIRRYHQAKTNAQDSVDALARFLRLLGTARLFANRQPFTLAAHSLGAHFLQNTLDVDGAVESTGTAHNIALLAPCTRAAGHRDWVSRLRPKGQVFVTFNAADLVLFGARIADAGQVKLGSDPGADRIASPQMRYIDFQGSGTDVTGHSYFAQGDPPRKTKRLFKRMFSSARDLDPGEATRKVYAGCTSDGHTCFMAASEVVDD